MGERLECYEDWDAVVKMAEANIEIITGNKIKAEVGLMSENKVLEYALKKRDQYPEPIPEKEEIPTGTN